MILGGGVGWRWTNLGEPFALGARIPRLHSLLKKNVQVIWHIGSHKYVGHNHDGIVLVHAVENNPHVPGVR